MMLRDDEILRLPDGRELGYADQGAPGRNLLDWPEDVSALADALEIDRFGVVGALGGGW